MISDKGQIQGPTRPERSGLGFTGSVSLLSSWSLGEAGWAPVPAASSLPPCVGWGRLGQEWEKTEPARQTAGCLPPPGTRGLPCGWRGGGPGAAASQKAEAERGALSQPWSVGSAGPGGAGKDTGRGIHLLFMWVVTDRNKFSTDLLNPLNWPSSCN